MCDLLSPFFSDISEIHTSDAVDLVTPAIVYGLLAKYEKARMRATLNAGLQCNLATQYG